MYFVIVRVLSAIAHLLFRIRVKGAEHIPKTGGIILCSNHKSVIDPLLLLIKSKRKIYYMAKSELFTDHGRLAGWFLRKAGAFPVPVSYTHLDVYKRQSLACSKSILTP